MLSTISSGASLTRIARNAQQSDSAATEVLDVAKRAGFSLDEARVLLQRTQVGSPAHEALRGLATRKLPEVDALIERAEAMRAWLITAIGCSCNTLDVCALFNEPDTPTTPSRPPKPLSITHVCGPAAPA
jgi:MerR family transcriptional regulator, redox-sensitive transcriptional activator SoxR